VSPKEDAVRLERIKAIRGIENGVTACPQHARQLDHGRTVIADVLDHLVQHDDVEETVRKREVLARGKHQIRKLLRPFANSIEGNIDSVHLVAEVAELADIHPYSAPNVQDPLSIEPYPGANEIEASVLAEAPDEARVAEGGTLVFEAWCDGWGMC